MNHLEQTRLNAAVQLRGVIQTIIQDPDGPANHHNSLRAVDALAAHFLLTFAHALRTEAEPRKTPA